MAWIEGGWIAACWQVLRCLRGSVIIAAFIASSVQAAAPDNYLINVGDELEFDILDDDTDPQRFTVGRDGMVQLPFIGGLRVEAIAVSEARELIRRTYIEREIFVNPGVELSIASFRPIFVLGDVRSPGNYDYQPFLTAEQAVGLAGGPAISANNEEARVLEKRNLEGSLTSLEYDIALFATQIARVQAQLRGASSVQWSDVPVAVRPDVNRELFDEHKTTEDQIIRLEAADFANRRQLLTDAVNEAERRVSLLDQRSDVLANALAVTENEENRVRDLVERGLIPKSEVNDTTLAVSRAEGQLLQVKEQRSSALVQLSELQGRLSQFDATRTKTLFSEAQQFWSEINKLITNRASVRDRLDLLQQWMNAASGLETELLVEYQVRRREDGGVRNILLQPFDELAPGDLLVIVVKPPESLREPG